MIFWQLSEKGTILTLKLIPNAAKCAVIGLITDEKGQVALKVSVNAVPEKNKANNALILFLAKILKVPKTSILVQTGHTSRYKKVLVEGDHVEKLEQLIKGFIKER